MQLWVAKIKQGMESPEDEPWPVPSQAAATVEKIADVHQIIMESQHMTIRKSHKSLEYLKKCVNHIIQQDLNMRKLSAQCLPRNPTKDQKYMHKMCQANLQ